MPSLSSTPWLCACGHIKSVHNQGCEFCDCPSFYTPHFLERANEIQAGIRENAARLQEIGTRVEALKHG